MRIRNLELALAAMLGVGSLNAEETSLPFADEAINAITRELSSLRLAATDLRLPKGWEMPFTIDAVEDFFDAPLSSPKKASSWLDAVETSTTPGSLFGLGVEILNGSSPRLDSPPPAAVPAFPKEIPARFQPLLRRLYADLSHAQVFLNAAVDSIKEPARNDFLSLQEWPQKSSGLVDMEISSRRIKAKYEGMKEFRQKDLLTAGELAIEAAERLQEELAQLEDKSIPKRIRWPTPFGTFVLSGPEDDDYSKEELQNIAVLIDLGGKNTYAGPVAYAAQKQIRLFVDYGSEVVITAPPESVGNAGCGVFGIGLLFLPNETGNHRIETGSFSQGCGVAGIGGLFIKGASRLKAGRFVQGTGIFGIGLLEAAQAKGSSYSAMRNGQGFGLIRGVGLFKHRGDESNVQGGLVEPDPREPLAAVSLCQGVGYGHRAYTGGGVGMAVLIGDAVSVKGSYFAQGSGYWHSLGAFRLRGNRSLVQARRYDQGTGVHSAFGHFELLGDKNRVLNWGVGPAYGWDHSLGTAFIKGDENEIQAEWGTGTASIGSLSFSYGQGDRCRLILPDFGKGQFINNENAYSVHLFSGRENKFSSPVAFESQGSRLSLIRNPWGFARFQGVDFSPDLKLTPPEWPKFEREKALEKEKIDLNAQMAEAEQKTGLEHVADLVDVASAFSLDKTTPRTALEKLLLISAEQVSYLIETLEPAAIDQLIQLRVAIPAHGDVAAKAILKFLDAYPQRKKAVLLNFLSFHRPSLVLPVFTDILEKPAVTEQQQQIKLAAARALGQFLNRDSGEEPGLRAILQALSDYLENPSSKKLRAKTLMMTQKIPLANGMGVAAFLTDFTPDRRSAFLKAGPEDITNHIAGPGAETLLRFLREDGKTSKERIHRELTALQETERKTRDLFATLLKSSQTKEATAAVVGMGQIGDAQDVQKLAPFLEHKDAKIREAAAVALARIGPAALPALRHGLESANNATRRVVAAALSQTTTNRVFPLMVQGLRDNDPHVRLLSIAAIDLVPDVLKIHRKKWVKAAKRRLKNEADPSVRLAVALLN